MPSLSPYKSELDYGYAPGVFPAMECLLHRPECARRVLLHSKAAGTEGAEKLTALAARLHIRVEEADKALARISGKENCFAAAVFSKFEDALVQGAPHVVLHHPSDQGNVGTILRKGVLKFGKNRRGKAVVLAGNAGEGLVGLLHPDMQPRGQGG